MAALPPSPNHCSAAASPRTARASHDGVRCSSGGVAACSPGRGRGAAVASLPLLCPATARATATFTSARPSGGTALRPPPPPISHNSRSMASCSKLSHAVPVSNTEAPVTLPFDALFEVLLRLPAKDLCRLRAVCRSWRALTSDPHFAALHKSRHAEPLFAVTFRDGDARGVAIVSLSGQILRRIRIASVRIKLLLTHLDRLCVFRCCKPSLAAWVLNPGTAAPLTLPGLHSDEFVGTCIELSSSISRHNCWTVTYAFGQVASTGDYKALRISHPHHQQSQLCDIITLDGSSQRMWRRKQNPPSGLAISEIMEPLALSGIVYFLFDYDVMEPASMAPFNLDTEKWMPTLHGPEPLRSANCGMWQLSLANLNGSLVMVDNDVSVSFDLWFLMDHKRGLWVKKYRISVEQEPDYYCPRPLLILDDGRIVIFEMQQRLLQCYDPRTGNLADMLDITAMGLGESQSICVYTGSLLI